MRRSAVYKRSKNVTDKLYSGEVSAKHGVTQLIELLAENGIRLRSNDHSLLHMNFFFPDKSEYRTNKKESVVLGLVYRKPDNTKTQDLFVVPLSGGIEQYYKEKDVVKKYPELKGMHKEKFLIVSQET